MCCLFTCCGWMIDLIQRLWTFTMSCCISSAICCALVTASMSGIALGYNYSLAEYIDLKETNVSVYLKRGIFDDEIGDDMDWRRSGHLPVAGHIGEHNLRTGAPEEDSTPVRSGRRLDDSIYESDDRNKFEGSLMKLTAKPPAPIESTESETTVNMDEIISKYTMGSIDQLKAIQSLINMKKAADARQRIVKGETKSTENIVDERYLPQMAVYPGGNVPGRRLLPHSNAGMQPPTPGDSARFAVPDEGLNAPGQWKLPKYPPEAFATGMFGDFDARPTYPRPVSPRAGPVRPSRPKPVDRPRPPAPTAAIPVIVRHEKEPNIPKSIDEEMDTFKEKLLLDKFDVPSVKDENFMKKMRGPKGGEEDYEDAIKGVPIRKKRQVSEFTNNINKTDNLHNDSETKDINNQGKSGLLYTVQEYVTKTLSKEINETSGNDMKTIIQLKNNTRAPSESISSTSSSTIVLKLLNITAT